MDSVWKSRSTVVFLLIVFGVPWGGWTLLAFLHPLRNTALWMAPFLNWVLLH
jgi:hypothetical protein